MVQLPQADVTALVAGGQHGSVAAGMPRQVRYPLLGHLLPRTHITRSAADVILDPLLLQAHHLHRHALQATAAERPGPPLEPGLYVASVIPVISSGPFCRCLLAPQNENDSDIDGRASSIQIVPGEERGDLCNVTLHKTQPVQVNSLCSRRRFCTTALAGKLHGQQPHKALVATAAPAALEADVPCNRTHWSRHQLSHTADNI